MKGYVEIFETMLDSLRFFAESEKPLNVKEIECKFGLHTRTAQRIAKSLEGAGWLTSKKTGCGNLFTATDKAKALFKSNENLVKALHNFKVNDCVVLNGKSVYFPDGTKKTNELFNIVRIGEEGLEIDLMEVGGTTKIFKTWIGDIQPATEQEIAAGCRDDNFKVGDKVEPIDPMYTLASGCERYPHAYVVSVNPFRLMSERGDMYWSATVKPENFKLIASNGVLPEGVLKRMKREFLIEDCGVLSE
ncbi:hypothetical protein [Acinetobacter pittii]|uniref:hypothetical protein n=1 Tax=Acinetobacter pittii TaxID=48296 RepID=UPI00355C4C23